MFRNFLLVIVPSIIINVLTIAINEWRFRYRQNEKLIKEIVENFLKLRQEGKNNQVYELHCLQSSGILLLKNEIDAKEVLRQIELRGKPVGITASMRKNGILQGLKELIHKGVNIEDFRELAIEDIGEALKS